MKNMVLIMLKYVLVWIVSMLDKELLAMATIVAWYKIAMLNFVERIFFSISCNY